MATDWTRVVHLEPWSKAGWMKHVAVVAWHDLNLVINLEVFPVPLAILNHAHTRLLLQLALHVKISPA